ncbi:hypothetical protein JCM8097_004358 [Rhodosporidiobolus ruineniae]
MAGSRFAYVRGFELPDPLLPSTFFIIRLDGKGFHGFSDLHRFDKPNDVNALELMNRAAMRVVGGRELNGECVLAFGESDEYSFVFKRTCKLHGRRASKLTTLVTSVFTAAYVHLWPEYFPHSPLQLDHLPVFDGRVVQYTTQQEIRDYLRWRQVDTHINNLYNTSFWALVLKGGRSEFEANKELSGTVSAQKQEMLFTQFGINYNHEPAMFRKGSLVVWEAVSEPEPEPETETETEPAAVVGEEGEEAGSSELSQPRPPAAAAADQGGKKPSKPSKPKKAKKPKRRPVVVHEDLIGDEWWETGRGRGVLDD